MSAKRKVLAENLHGWKLLITDDKGAGFHIGTARGEDSPRGLHIDEDQIDDIVFELLRAKRKGKL